MLMLKLALDSGNNPVRWPACKLTGLLRESTYRAKIGTDALIHPIGTCYIRILLPFIYCRP
jgi:hypothetical protein